MSDRADRQYVTVKMATAMTGIPERTLRRWMSSGQLPATAAKGGRLIALDDVERIAGASRSTRGHPSDTATPAEPVATAMTADSATVAAQQLATLRDGLVAPLVELTERQQQRIAELERENGALESRVRELEAQQATTAMTAPNVPQTGLRSFWRRLWER
jgi:DNA-binding transcriptional MerR regulator